MTAEPHLHCDHECVCWWYYDHQHSGSAAPCQSDKCYHRFRLDEPAKSEAVLEELIKWLYEEGMKFEKICDSEENFVNATGACARRAQCYYTIEKLKELRQQEREQG